MTLKSESPGERTGVRNRERILSIEVDALDLDRTLEVVAGWLEHADSKYVCLATAHGVMDARAAAAVAAAYLDADLTVPDGMSIVWLLRVMGHESAGRVYGPDLVRALCRESAARGWRHFFVGGEPGVAERLVGRLNQQFPGLQIAGTASPAIEHVETSEEGELASRIRGVQADIVWVGLGSPKQDLWMQRNRERLGGAVAIGVGAAFDFLSGRKKQAPRWMQGLGMEWLFRWSTEPVRLAARYLRYPLFAVLVARQLVVRWVRGPS